MGGQTLIIPNKVHNAHNNADTFTVYNPNKIIGDPSPTVPKKPPPPKAHGVNGCAIFGEIAMVVIAAVVTFYTAGIAGTDGQPVGSTSDTAAAAVRAVAGTIKSPVL